MITPREQALESFRESIRKNYTEMVTALADKKAGRISDAEFEIVFSKTIDLVVARGEAIVQEFGYDGAFLAKVAEEERVRAGVEP